MQQAQNKTNDTDEEEEEEEEEEIDDMELERRRKYIEENNSLYDFNTDEIDELEELKMHLEPEYQRYAKWKI